MTSEQSYRLDNYRIIVYDDVLVRWEQHAPLGVARSGKCYVYGDVLIIGKKSSDEDGFLIGEFLDRLRKMPPWTETRYYCFAGDLIDTATGQGLVDETLERFSSFADRNRAVSPEAKAASPGTWRLGQYRITVAADHAISWQAYGELNRIMTGPCSIEADILIIGPQEHDEEAQGKQEFLDALNRLQQWDQTTAWCRGSVLRTCKDPRREEPGIIARLRERRERPVVYNEPAPLPRKRSEPAPEPALKPERTIQYCEIAKGFLLSGWSASKNAWQRVQAGKKSVNCLVVLLATMLLLGLAAAVYIAEEGFPWSHGVKKHHHKHHDH